MDTIAEVRIPDIGDFRDVEVIEILITPGVRIEPDAPLITLESHKATLEVPAPYAGVVKEITVAVGDKVSEGDLILTMIPEQQIVPEEQGRASAAIPPHASPSVRRHARELGIDPGALHGAGHKGRILRQDVQQAAATITQTAATNTLHPDPDISPPASSPAQAPDFSDFGAVETRPLTRIQRLSGANLSRTWAEIPQVTQHDFADISDLDAFRQSLRGDADARGVHVTLLGFLMKVSVAALKAFPTFNASLAPDGGNLILKHYYHIGVAMDTPEGLVVPVIREVDKKGIFELAQELAAMTHKARDKRLSPGDLKGGCFTISSLGALGGTGFTPILNAPEVAILGVGRSAIQPVYRENEFQPRRMLPLSLSYDHRVIDGVNGARFLNFICSSLADIRRLLL